MSSKVCSGKLKCSAAGALLNLRWRKSERCKFMRKLRPSLVSPTYCLPQTLHVIRYTTFDVLQLALPLMYDFAPVRDEKDVAGVINMHVLHLGVLQGPELPVVGLDAFEPNFACTRMSRRLFGLLYAMIGFCGNIVLSRCDDSMVGQCLSMVDLIFGRSG